MERIFKLIKDNGQVSPHELKQLTGLGAPIIFRHLKKLQDLGRIRKIGKSPKVYYSLVTNALSVGDDSSTRVSSSIVEENFSVIEPSGEEFAGMKGFSLWCSKRKLDVAEMVKKYENTFSEYAKFSTTDYIDATKKLTTTFTATNEKYLDKLYYLYFYSYPVFGRTKISNWLFYGKSLQQKELIKKVLDLSVAKIYKFILDNKIEAVVFAPATVPREVQFMKELETALNLNLPTIKCSKLKTSIIIQQKSLKSVEDRVRNAENSIVVESRNNNYERVLVLDDFTGSGATLNVIARKCKAQGVAREVFGLTITGSVNGFEVVNEI